MAPLISFKGVLVACAVLLATVSAQTDSQLVGTWTTKSRKVLTGPGFYDPVGEKFIEPDLTGISYSFTADGFFEEAYYRAISNPTNPSCPSGIMQFQHGKYTVASNGSLLLTPFAVDGRQLLSEPCEATNAVYTRYNQSEIFEKLPQRYEVQTDGYHNVLRLNLYQFDGTPMNPMYIAYKPPQMLPTQTLNPTATATGGTTSTGSSKVKRGLAEEVPRPLNYRVMQKRSGVIDADKWWWFGVGMTALGGVTYFCF
ncbi:MAG: Reversal of tor2 lethality [Sarea resinae]|nr:MAG: Reversal of tor2 lethality [Sarea resinae]